VTSINAGMGALSTFTAIYDAAGQLTNQTLPNGTTAAIVHDNAATRRSLTYVLPASGGVSNTLTFTATPDAFDKTVNTESPASAQADSYDNAGRLTQVADTTAGACTTRSYGFDAQGDRTSLTTYGPGSGGTCQTTTGSTVTTGYDTANRIATSAGYSYDPLGRATSIPANNLASGNGSLTVGYYDTDMPKTLTQGSTSKAFTLDPAGRYRTVTDTTSGTETRRNTNHYASGTGDSPNWINTSTDSGATWTWQRNIRAFGGFAAIQNQDGTTTLQIANLHGDIVATVPNQTSGAGTTTSSFTEATEYGLTRYGFTGGARYGWLGSSQRSSDTLAGIVLMGVRLYNPSTGQFLSRDPLQGGNENSYNYPNDPINMVDLSGTHHWWYYPAMTAIGFATTALEWAASACGWLTLLCSGLIGGLGNAAMTAVSNYDAGRGWRQCDVWDAFKVGFALGLGVGIGRLMILLRNPAVRSQVVSFVTSVSGRVLGVLRRWGFRGTAAAIYTMIQGVITYFGARPITRTPPGTACRVGRPC
jgi:RHS repeat-associated protein